MHLRYVVKFPSIAAVMCAAASVSLGACSGSDPVDDGVVAAAGEAQELTAESAEALTCPADVPHMDLRKSFIVTKEMDPAILAQDAFKLETVLRKLITSVGSDQTPLDVYRRWWDTQNVSTSAAFSDAIHCNDNGLVDGNGFINGFPFACPRAEGALATTDPFVDGPNFMEPVALVNRFDLAPKDDAPEGGAHCGEYRIIYAKKSGQTNNLDRNLIIFEGQLPNPHPECGVAACLPVAEFWASLSTMTDEQRAEKLREFYHDGLDGFDPVLQASNFMHSTGQIRTNQFMQFPWTLREFKLDVGTDSADNSVRLFFKPVTVKENPFEGLFSSSFDPNDSRGVLFQSSFLGALDGLVPSDDDENDISLRTLPIPDVYNAAESPVDPSKAYSAQLQTNPAFMTSIETALDPILQSRGLWPNAVTAEDAADRAGTQSCAGCHQLSDSGSLGGLHVWLGHDPARQPNAFVHVDELGRISAPLEWKFLPHRAQVLKSFIEEKSCTTACTPTAESASFAAASAEAPLDGAEQVRTLGGSTTH
ncbi:hypothetical protein [Sorangium sp. So ce1335]|uniref:hypothetical protein n=1 Tax=Sorangium sp. So ce1335 TaxID=3133335 RepID=UPI003F5F159F